MPPVVEAPGEGHVHREARGAECSGGGEGEGDVDGYGEDEVAYDVVGDDGPEVGGCDVRAGGS